MTTAPSVDRQLDLALEDVAVNGSAEPMRFVELLPDLFAPTQPSETLQTVVRLARQFFRCDGAGVVLTGNRGGPATTRATGADAARADALQVEHHQGPAFDAVAGRQPVLSAELRFDSRWRFWGPSSADLGFRSVLSLPLTDQDPFGALTLYSRHPSFFRGESLGPELRFAQQVSLAIALTVEREQLVRARDSRGIVGQAQGILMERYRIGADEAFAVLRRYSSHQNQKLRLVAEQVIADRSLPRPADRPARIQAVKPYQA